ncbi:substrate-binding domain-containing protein [Rhodovulum visakhapatnamense]|uniref:Spermidine/putrescine transport system substrate-binding protein n=1 Tax=Rhodovulum visakhapatnamense TaxID=364297 RepID=A0A4R8G8T9_9RHOB|nr:substrate-binding domain-containing protein [Rhodovulum visakhapatnamense]TDX31876.1 spermidine/putrescine transport system substrate-binding protein [Rhodovulum visakhapatnamense]
MNRRDLLKTALAGTALGAFGPAFRADAATGILWMTWENLAKDDYLAPFLAANDIALTKTFIGTDDEQFAKLRAGGADSVDLITPGLDKVEYYTASDLLQPIDFARVPNAAKLYDTFKQTPLGKVDGQTYGIPFYWGINPIVYRADLMEAEPDWSVFFEGDAYNGKLAMRDYALEGIMIAAMYLGIPESEMFTMDDRQLAEVKKVLKIQKSKLRTYWNSIGDLTNLFATGEVVCAFSWVPPYYELRAKGIDMGMAKPKQGVIGWCDTIAVPKGVEGARLDAAFALVDYLLGPDYGKMLAVGGPYAQSTSAARDHLTEEQQDKIFIKDLSVMDSFVWKQNPPRYGDWVALWNEVKAS